ncbi:MAG: dTDP-4-dehydrorhamnose 3,5-epimerase family protein [Pirellulales bacterium]
MNFLPTAVEGALLIEIAPQADDRGFFARTWCEREFTSRGLMTRIAQASVASSRQRGTLRGLHYQEPPHAEDKLVRCTRGAAYVVALDLRRDSASYLRWIAAVLTADNHRQLYVPRGCAQGYLTMADGTELVYQMSEFYEPACARGVRYDDPAFGIAWPEPVRVISDADRNRGDYQP